MPVYVERAASEALWRTCVQISQNLRPGSRAVNSFRKDLRTICVDDHTDMLLRGVDRYGKPRAPLAASTLKNRKRGPGPSLVPRGKLSRFVANFEAVWLDERGVMFLVMRYVDILSKATRNSPPRPFAQYHATGTRHMPRRDTGGITPTGWPKIRARLAQLARDVVTMGGGR